MNLQRLIDSALGTRRWRRKDLVVRLGYRNIDKGLRRLGGIGFARPADAAFARRVCEILQLDQGDLHAAWTADRAGHEEILRAERRRDPRYYLVIRFAPCVYVRRELESVTDISGAIALAGKTAIGRRRCIDAPDGTFHWLNGIGQVTGTTGPGTGPSIRIG